MNTLQDVYAALDRLRYAPATYADVERKIRQAPRLYGVASLSEIPADLNAFDEKWKGRDDALALGFRTVRSFELWRTHVRGAMQRALGFTPKPARAQRDAWHTIQEHLEAKTDRRHLKLVVLASRARQCRRAPRDITDTWIRQQHDQTHDPRRSSFRQGVVALNTLINERQDHLPILELLPDAPFALPETNARQPFGGIELPESFWEDLAVFEAFVCARRKIDEPADDDELDEDEGIHRQQRIAPYRDALSWLIRELIADEAIDPMAIHEVADVVDSQLVLRAAKRFRHRRDAGETKSEASTLHHYVRRLYAIARVWLEVPDDEQQRFRNLLKKKSVQTRNVGNIAADREIWLRHVILDKKSVIRDTLLHAPETFMNEADRRLRCWSELSVTERVRTLHFAMVAAQMALLVRAMAVRRRNLRELRFRGPQPTFIPPTGTSQPWIDIPPEEVKNERHLRAPVPEPAWRMIKRWLEVYRPLLVHHHPTGHTASDNDFVFPGRDGPISESQLERAFHFAVGTLGLGMSPHMIRHAVAGIILHENPNMLEAVADFLGNDPKTVRKYYSFLDTARGVSESQNVLADQAQKARKRQNTARRRQRRGT